MEEAFEFSDSFGDARVAELQLLAWVDRVGQLTTAVPHGHWADLLVASVSDGLLTAFSYEKAFEHFKNSGAGSSPMMDSSDGIEGSSLLERSFVMAKIAVQNRVFRGERVDLRITHRGRVRLSELKQALRSGRERDTFGILWDVRHWERDLQIALLETSQSAPLSVAYIDMNGLKELNDKQDHDQGDKALRVYFQAVASVLGDTGQAYRLGGDEVLVVLPGDSSDAAVRKIQGVARQMVSGVEADRTSISIAAGIVCLTNQDQKPPAVRHEADIEQKRAKERSRLSSPRPSVIAIQGVSDLIVLG